MDPWELVALVTVGICLILLFAVIIISHGQEKENRRQRIINEHLLLNLNRALRVCGLEPLAGEQDEWARKRRRPML